MKKKRDDIKTNKAYIYARDVANGKINAPKYVKKQCRKWLVIANGKSEEYYVSAVKIRRIRKLLKLLIMPKGYGAGKPVYSCFAGFQWFFVIAVLCTVRRDEPQKRKYENVVLEICRKNGKTFLVAVIFILLLLTEPCFSRFFSVAPDGSLSREVKAAIEAIVKSSPALNGSCGKARFKLMRSEIKCLLNDNNYMPLNYSRDRLDGKEPSVFLADEAGALPEAYAIEAMRSGQIMVENKLGCIISTKYPKFDNPFEDEVAYAKNALDDVIYDENIFALLYEPDNTKDWATDNSILEQSNPLAVEMPKVMEDLQKKRAAAIEMPKRRQNFLTKHCNIIYQGLGTESYVDVADVQKGRVKKIEWRGRKVYLGIDLAMSNDNCAVAMAARSEDGGIDAEVLAFIPEGKIEQKSKFEKINYEDFIAEMKCIACGDRTVDYGVIEEFVLNIEEKYGVKIVGIAYDRYNALSSAMKFEKEGYVAVEVDQHSRTLHAPTKLLSETIDNNKLHYETNTLLEINFQNAKCTYDTNMNRYVNKKRSAGKVDMVVALINAVYLMQQTEDFGAGDDWAVQVA